MSERFWSSAFALGAFLLVGALLLGLLALGAGLVYQGARLLPRRTWRQVDAQVERVEVDDEGAEGYYCQAHYKFTVPGAARSYAGFLILKARFQSRFLADLHASDIRAAGTIPIWYAEGAPTLNYPSRPQTAWQVVKGLILVAGGLLILGSPLLLLR